MQRLTSSSTAKFADSGQSGGYNHQHASQMAHSAALRQQAARALSGLPTSRAPTTPGGNAGTPGGAIHASVPVQQVSAATGAHPAHVHMAINGLVQQGKLTPLQGVALKTHNGPVKPAVVGMVASALPRPPQAPTGIALPVAGQKPRLPVVPQ